MNVGLRPSCSPEVLRPNVTQPLREGHGSETRAPYHPEIGRKDAPKTRQTIGGRAMRLHRLREKSTRRLIAVIFCGKMLGVVAILFATTWLNEFIGTPASAASTVTHHA